MIKLYKLSKQYLNISYNYGSWNIYEGLDCLSLIYLFRQNLGYDISDMLKGAIKINYSGKEIDINNYKDELKTHEDRMNCFKLLLENHFEKSEIPKLGYVLLYNYAKETCIGLYLKQNKMLMIDEEHGTRIVKTLNKKYLIGIYN